MAATSAHFETGSRKDAVPLPRREEKALEIARSGTYLPGDSSSEREFRTFVASMEASFSKQPFMLEAVGLQSPLRRDQPENTGHFQLAQGRP